ncbi:hypothetical protein BX659_11944 [Orenia metallireducens]|jgi:Tfp pilus assembly protein PilO|uniref:Tfp pilus assembly protein PilO n=1 Tax=Orenia metallireducens TaxID=1413210 RepID=A0A285HMS7_9FIRM|nr:hypothetical protein [Orenia metallireducens]PRX26680.1 hypothetical protein BX659_11944 [Orenia metallireducens]SNY36066.1 hypothetical protein SAMN06265827_12044 [Orenia metallireducens]
MWKKWLVIVLILLLIGSGFYEFIYNPLYAKYQQNIIEFSHLSSELDKKRVEVLALQKLEEEYKSLLAELEEGSDNNLLNKDEINSFIIKLNSYTIIKKVDFTLPPKEELLISLEINGNFQEIYDLLESIEYLYNTKAINIRQSKEEVVVNVSLLFPIERNES